MARQQFSELPADAPWLHTDQACDMRRVCIQGDGELPFDLGEEALEGAIGLVGQAVSGRFPLLDHHTP